jgi:hypothetical protein
MGRRQRALRSLLSAVLVLAVVVGVGAAGVRPAAASGAPVMGPSRLTAAQIAAWFRASTRSVYRASVPVEQLAADYVWEGNAANVRGDIAFAQSVLETGWFNFPAGGYVAPTDNNFAGIGAYGGGHLFRAPDADTGVRGQIQLLRRYADRGSRQNNIGYPPVPQLWNPPSSYDTLNTTHGWAPTWADMSGTWASSTTYATSVLKIYNSMLLFAGLPGDCPPDSLAVGRVAFNTAGCPAALAQPGRAVAARPGGGTWVLNGNGQVQALDGAPSFGAPLFGWDIARDIAAMPDGNGYMVLDGFGGVHKFGSATALANLAGPYFGWDIARSLAITADGRGYMVLDGWGGAHAVGDAPSLGAGYWPGWDIARSIAITGDERGIWLLDGYGAVHTAGDAVFLGAPYFGWDIARDLAAFGDGSGYAVLDGWGGVHPFGRLRAANPFGWAQADRWRGIDLDAIGYLVLRNDGTSTHA